MRSIFTVLLVGCLWGVGCSSEKGKTRLTKHPFGKMTDGTPVDLFVLTNKNGAEVDVTTYGAAVTSLKVPDRHGVPGDVVLGFDSLEGYLKDPPYFGAIVGRYGNRIAKGRFTLDGVEYKLAVNNGENSLHGGKRGFDKVVWTAEEVDDRVASVDLTYRSKDGEEGYPGNLSAQVFYTLTDDNELKITYVVMTDKPTVVNLTNHSYFNLAGQGEGDILKHMVTIDADQFTPVDAGLIPTGELRSVKGTPFDFTTPHAIGERINNDDEQLKFGKGYDHNWVLRGGDGTMKRAAEVYEPSTGRVMEVWTTQPGLQFYTGNFLDGTIIGKQDRVYQKRYAFCMETQHFPDSPNQPKFPSTVLKPGETLRSETVYKFSVR